MSFVDETQLSEYSWNNVKFNPIYQFCYGEFHISSWLQTIKKMFLFSLKVTFSFEWEITRTNHANKPLSIFVTNNWQNELLATKMQNIHKRFIRKINERNKDLSVWKNKGYIIWWFRRLSWVPKLLFTFEEYPVSPSNFF